MSPSPGRGSATGAKPDSPTAMRLLIARMREAIPFDVPAAEVCAGSCEGCSRKLLEFLDTELQGWDMRLDAGERVGLADLSRLAAVGRTVYAVLERNGLVGSDAPRSASD